MLCVMVPVWFDLKGFFQYASFRSVRCVLLRVPICQPLSPRAVSWSLLLALVEGTASG